VGTALLRRHFASLFVPFERYVGMERRDRRDCPWTVTAQQQADYLVGAFEYADENWPWMGPMFVVYDYGAVGRYSKCWPPCGYSILRDDESSENLVSPAAAALFAMPKHSAW
jgi:hypothetical protein